MDPFALFTGPVTIIGPGPAELEAIVTRVVRRELHPIEEMLMSQSGQIQAYTSAVNDLLSDVATKLANLQAAIENPDDQSNLSPQARAELDAAVTRLQAFRTDENVGDENGDGVPAAPEPAPVDTNSPSDNTPQTFSVE